MFVIDRSLYLSPEVVREPGLRPLKEVDPFSLEALVAWLEKQPARAGYCYANTGHCLFAQYFSAAGFIDIGIGEPSIYHGPPHARKRCALPETWIPLAKCEPHTFGAALSRARKLLAEREK